MKNLIYILMIIFYLITTTEEASAIEVNSQTKGMIINSSSVFLDEPSFSYLDLQYKYPRVMTSNLNARAIDVNCEYLKNLLSDDVSEFTIENYPISLDQNANVVFQKSNSAVGLGTRWIRKTSKGEILAQSFEPIFYVGKIVGEVDSKVTLFLCNNEFYSIIERLNNENFSITPTSGITEKNVHILTSQQTTLLGMDYNPFLDLHFDGQEEIDFEKYIKKAEQSQSSELLQADIIVQATNDFYKLFKDYDKTAAYISAIMTHSSQIFETNLNVTLFVPMVVIQEDEKSDPYNSTTQIYDRLTQVRENWKNNTVKRALVCLLTDIDYQGGSGGYRIGGVSMGLGTLCKNNQAYCVFGMQGHYNYPTTNYTWDVSVSAHEMGHAFGGPHTHSCYYAPNMIDTCITRNLPQEGSDGCVTTGNPIPRLGTLMSYCHLTNSTRSVGLYFHERDKPVIRGFAESASCLKAAIDPTLILLNPSGGSTLFPGDKAPIRWSSSKIEYVAIKYSIDNGKKWIWIEKYADAKAGQFLWSVPDTSINNVILHISDSYNASVSDQTDIPLSIDRPHFAMVNPQEGTRLGQKEKYKIKWEQKYINSIKIEFTSKSNLINSGGDPQWSILSNNSSGFEQVWDIPEIESQNCMLRLTGKTEFGGEFVIYSGNFAIGKATCEILSPKTGDKLCANTKFDIQWKSDFISNVFLIYSIDGGTKWRNVSISKIAGSDEKYTWNVPSNYTDNCLIRILHFDNRDLVLAEHILPFTIDSCEMSVDDNQSETSNELSILDITPNPASNDIKIKFDFKSAILKPIEIIIVNTKGEQLVLKNHTPTKFGENIIDFELNNLVQGNYFIVLQSGKNRVSKNLVIIK